MKRGLKNGNRINRRRFLEVASASAMAGLSTFAATHEGPLGNEDAAAPTKISEGAAQIRVLLHEADGSPLDSERARTLIARDLANDPIPAAIASATGRARVVLQKEALQLAARLKVPNFGEVYCYADNQGLGYKQPGQFEFVLAAARSRLNRVQELLDQKGGADCASEVRQRLAEARAALQSGGTPVAAAYASLALSLKAGEMLTTCLAQARIRRLREPRRDFLFGGMASGWQRGEQFTKPFRELFNFATVSWYSWNRSAEPSDRHIDYSRMDQSINWCLENKITPKGFGYVYLANGATPEWLRSWPYPKVLAEYKLVVTQTMRRYAGRLPFVEVINEAHDKANLFHFSHEQILELTCEACKAAREGSANVKRLINHCCLWAEYGRRPNPNGTRRWSPFTYLKDCFARGVECERIGLQLYYPQYDLLEIDRMLDRFATFHRPLHITEISCNSAQGLDPASMRPKSLVPGWHGPWNETMQADWLESIYTLCYSKESFEAVGYWDLADAGGHFWPHGGLLHNDFTPKESFHRLAALKKQWGLG